MVGARWTASASLDDPQLYTLIPRSTSNNFDMKVKVNRVDTETNGLTVGVAQSCCEVTPDSSHHISQTYETEVCLVGRHVHPPHGDGRPSIPKRKRMVP